MYKYIIFLLVFLLSSCFSSTTNNEESLLKEYNVGQYSIYVPSNWSVIKDTSSILPKPSVWNISLAVTSTQVVDWFSNNLLIMSNKELSNVNSYEYSHLNNLASKEEYYEYSLIEEFNTNINQNENTRVYLFEARYNQKTPKLKFIQTAVICNDNWYVITIALANSTKDLSKYKDIFETFKCK